MRLIDADALPSDDFCGTPMVLQSDIDSAPTIDAVPVVRCVECKHFREFDEDYKRRWKTEWDGSCRFWNNHSTIYSQFCGYGERKDNVG